MKPANMFVAAQRIGSGDRLQGVFQPTKLGPLPFLLAVEPVSITPVRPALEHPAGSRHRKSAAGWSDKLEALALKLVVALFVMTLLATGFGVQQIAYARSKNQLGRQLKQKEQELQAVTQAYRHLESRKAIEVAQASAIPENLVACVNAPVRDGTPAVLRASPTPGPKLTQARPVADPHRVQLRTAASRPRTRGAGVRG
jgi:hypothetical protein